MDDARSLSRTAWRGAAARFPDAADDELAIVQLDAVHEAAEKPEAARKVRLAQMRVHIAAE